MYVKKIEVVWKFVICRMYILGFLWYEAQLGLKSVDDYSQIVHLKTIILCEIMQ